MTTFKPLPLILMVLLAGWLQAPAAARAENWWLQAGWSHSDVGLDDEGDGFWTGVQGVRPLKARWLELGYSLAYVEKVGAQQMLFSDVRQGNRLGSAEVTLHVLEPAVTLGVAAMMGSVRIKLYGGGAVGLKLSEQWDQPVGSADRQYSYENLDLIGLAGLNLRRGSWLLDFRYGAGLLDQLLVEGVVPQTAVAKAEDPLSGADLPTAGRNVSGWRLGLGYRLGG